MPLGMTTRNSKTWSPIAVAKQADLRSYLKLEKALSRRLIRSWTRLSAPTYAAITAACEAKEWDTARRLVEDLDMTEVGTRNQEWIKYILLSTAVFGASIIEKGQPTFVAAGTYDGLLSQVTRNILQYLETSATQQVQEDALQLIALDEKLSKEADGV